MRKLSMIIPLAVGLSSVAAAQEVRLPAKPPKLPANQTVYQPGRQVIFSGTVTGKTKAKTSPGRAEAVGIIVRTPNNRSVQVDVGPSWFVANQIARIQVGDRVKVVGSRATQAPDAVILAKQITNSKGNVLTLRDLSGQPYWTYYRDNTPIPRQVPRNAVTGRITGTTQTEISGTTYGAYNLETDNGPVTVVTAPDWYLREQIFTFSPGAYVTVISRGMPIQMGPNVIMANTIYGSGVAIVLNPGGVPIYQGWGP